MKTSSCYDFSSSKLNKRQLLYWAIQEKLIEFLLQASLLYIL